jgi:hypothetical protein
LASFLPLPVHEAAYGGNSLGWVAGRPPGKRQLTRSMIPFPTGGNSNLELVEENK